MNRSDPPRPGRRRVLLGILLATACAVLLARIRAVTLQNEFPLGYDARSYLAASIALRQGISPYDDLDMARLPIPEVFSKYLYTPALAALLLPVSRLPFLLGTYICVALAAASAGILARLLSRSVNGKLALIAVFAFPPTWHTVYLGQVNLAVAGLLLLGVHALDSDRRVRLGIHLALASVLKLTPLVAAGMLFLRGYWRALLAWALSIGLLALLTWPVAAPGLWLESSHYALRQLWTFPGMLSWTGYLVHALPGAGEIVALVISCVLLIYTLMRLRSLPPRLVLAAGILLPLLVVRIVWEHHAVLALPALLILWQHSPGARLIAGLAWAGIALAGGIVMPISLTLCWAASCWPESADRLVGRVRARIGRTFAIAG